MSHADNECRGSVYGITIDGVPKAASYSQYNVGQDLTFKVGGST